MKPERGRPVRGSPLSPTSEWHSRGRIPHWEAGDTPQSITFRLADSLSRSVLATSQSKLVASVKRRLDQDNLDVGHGECLLARPEAGAIVQNALLHFDGGRYRLHAWCVMPNHVHVLLTPFRATSLSAIVHSWKSFTAHAINTVLGRPGRLWAEEYFDRAIRDDAHFAACKDYFENNPVSAGLCATPSEWPFSSWRTNVQLEADETSALRTT